MLTWLDNFWNAARRTVGEVVADAVHWAEHAMMSVVYAIYTVLLSQISQLGQFARDVAGFGQQVYNDLVSLKNWVTDVAIPDVYHWALDGLNSLANKLYALSRILASWVGKLLALIASGISNLYHWVLRNVWAPLWAFVKQAYNDLIKWGYTAWWYITHPAALADLLILDLARSAEKQAWTLARMLGQFTLSLILANLNKVTALVEDIITAVL